METPKTLQATSSGETADAAVVEKSGPPPPPVPRKEQSAPFKYNIERYEYEGNELRVTGWLYSESCDFYEFFLELDCDGTIITVPVNKRNYRADVEEFFKNSKARYSGFREFFSVENCKAVNVKLIIITDDDNYSFDIGGETLNPALESTKPIIRHTSDVIKSGSILRSFDRLVYENNALSFHGWIFPKIGEVIETSMCVSARGVHKILPIKSRNRPDVRKVHDYENALYSGFAENCFVFNAETVSVGIFVTTVKEKYYVFAGELKADEFFVEELPPVIGNNSSYNFNLDFVEKNTLKESYVPDAAVYEKTVDICVPVYNGFGYLETLFNSIPKTKVPFRLFISDDNSTDERVLPFLEEISLRFGENCVLLKNEENSGFPGNCNKMLRLTTNNVVLLNTDIELPDMWLERLVMPFVKSGRIASATPMSNSATIFNFPAIDDDRSVIPGDSLENIDNVFKRIIPAYTIVPTAHGFCMAISRAALDKVGLFDEVTFKKGNAEENDWSMRASDLGFINVAVENLFVYHRQSGSFTSADKMRLLNLNRNKLNAKHPTYITLVGNHRSLDPLNAHRAFAALHVFLPLGRNILITGLYGIGGGSVFNQSQKIRQLIAQGYCVWLIANSPLSKDEWKLTVYYGDRKAVFRVDSFEIIEYIFENVSIERVIISQMHRYPHIQEKLELLLLWKQKYKFALEYHFHDYLCICRNDVLLDNHRECCGIRIGKACANCLPLDPVYDFPEDDNTLWRKMWYEFLRNCDCIHCFSEDGKAHMLKAYPELNSITIIPHAVDYIAKLPAKTVKRTHTINVGIIGAIGEVSKGGFIIRELIELVEKKKCDICIKFIGYADDIRKYPGLTQTGEYTPFELPHLILEHDIDIAVCASICPETFSYTVQEAIEMDIPIVCFDLGAPAERVSKYEKGIIAPEISAECLLYSILIHTRTCLKMPVITEKWLFIIQNSKAPSHTCRVTAFREQLWLKGIDSDICTVSELDGKDFSAYSKVIIQRNGYSEMLQNAAKKIRKLNIPLLYEIDDMMFDYELYKASGYNKTRLGRFTDAESNCDACYAGMLLADSFIASTESLAQQIREHFPGKECVVRRNVADLKQMGLSQYWRSVRAFRNTSTVVIGYFSGTNTHNEDFALIGSTLTKILEKYENAVLHIYGYLDMPTELSDYGRRIQLFAFSPLAELPERYSNVDIALAPLEDSIFNQCKSEIKWIEAGLLGVPCVMSRNAETELAITNGIDGFLCTGEDEWFDTLSNLVENKALREEIGKNALETILKKCTVLVAGILD
jgi:GT2 family glycosyltransferase/glycosyltransferase involved in cell wall biosynthesis